MQAAFVSNTLMGSDWDVLVTSYEVAIIEKTPIKKFTWRCVVGTRC